jgi:arginase
MAIHMIGMPLGYGAGKHGTKNGPDKFREMNTLEVINKLGFDVHDLGDIEVSEVDESHAYKYDEKLKYMDIVVDSNTRLAFKVYDSISRGNFPFVIGGDHSLGMGSIAGVSKHIKNLGVIWIDAHGDLNTSETSPTGNIHGMPLAASMGLGNDKLVNLFEHRVKIKDENVVLIGARDLDEGEIALINNSNIKAFNMDKVREMGMERVIEETIKHLSERVDGVHVSFDIDFIDATFVPGTGTPVAEGGKIEEAKMLLGALARSGMMVSLDFVELNPVIDENETTSRVAMEIIEHVFENLKEVAEEQLLG